MGSLGCVPEEEGPVAGPFGCLWLLYLLDVSICGLCCTCPRRSFASDSVLAPIFLATFSQNGGAFWCGNSFGT